MGTTWAEKAKHWALMCLIGLGLLCAGGIVLAFIAAVLEPQPTTVTCTGSLYTVTCTR